jgi:hypothetical protein
MSAMPYVPAVAFAAKSTEDTKGSIPDQLADARALADEHGLTIVREFRDEARSAYSGNRGPGLAQAMAECERLVAEHGTCALIVQHSDRLARGDGKVAKHLVEYVLWALKSGVTIRSVQDAQTFGDGDLLYAVVSGQRNHEDSARKSASVKDGLRRRRDDRQQPVGGVPFGYMVDHAIVEGQVMSRRVPDPALVPLIERIYDMVESGLTFFEIARTLNADGIPGKPGRGKFAGQVKPWAPRNVRSIITNSAYCGAKNYPAIIDADRWQRINGDLRRLDPTATQRRKGGRRPADESYFLRSIARCKHCKESLYTRQQAVGRVYVCANRRMGNGVCDAPVIPAELLEGLVLRHLDFFVGSAETWIDEQVQQRSGDQSARVAAVSRHRAALADLSRQRDRQMAEYRRMVAEGDRLARYALEEVERVDEEREAQERVIAEAEAVVAEWQGPPEIDAALDFYNALVALVRGQITEARGPAQLNAALGQVLAGLWASLDDEELHVEFELRVPDDTPGMTSPWARATARANPGRRVSLTDAVDVPDPIEELGAWLAIRAGASDKLDSKPSFPNTRWPARFRRRNGQTP